VCADARPADHTKAARASEIDVRVMFNVLEEV